MQDFLKKHFLKKEHADHNFSNSYLKFCKSNNLILNEHAFYCNCSQSLKDNLKIETRHKHTKIDWVKRYEDILQMLIKNFAYARRNYFNSLDDTTNNSCNQEFTLNEEDIKKEHLKSAFGDCYRILDKIAMAVLDALDINYKNIFKENDIKNNVTFLNLWDFDDLFNIEFIELNPYLMTLYSIAKDLDRDKKISAFTKFRGVRNSIEHKLFFITAKPQNNEKDIVYITKGELNNYCSVLLHLTKSAIFSFTYFIRKESISKAREINGTHTIDSH